MHQEKTIIVFLLEKYPLLITVQLKSTNVLLIPLLRTYQRKKIYPCRISIQMIDFAHTGSNENLEL